ncbi:hypothetical protein Ancab_036599 [Ancistrocladus abbreviatus]
MKIQRPNSKGSSSASYPSKIKPRITFSGQIQQNPPKTLLLPAKPCRPSPSRLLPAFSLPPVSSISPHFYSAKQTASENRKQFRLSTQKMPFKFNHFLSHPPRLLHIDQNHQSLRAFTADVDTKFVRDRGLDHAVEKEKNLKTMLNLKNLIKSEPSKSLPLSTIAERKDTLQIPIRPIEFVRKYPTIFEEFFPGNIGIHPHVRLTQDVLSLDADEQLIYESDAFRKGAADRLLKLLMLCRVHEIPLKLVDRLKWDLGLPDNYVKALVPEFPDYFRVKSTKNSSIVPSRDDGSNEALLELVCWDNELAVSVMEKKAAMNQESGYQKGMPIAFPLHFSKGFELDKQLKKLIDDWQKLSYISPYENASHLRPKSDQSDKWAVAVLHELLHIFVPKKTERDNILCLGEYLGIRSRFKRALVHHPGIFYLSSKIGTYTVVLREAYKRDVLIEKHPLMEMRSRYIHLMNTIKDVQKPNTVPSSSQKQAVKEVQGEGEKEEVQLSDSESEDESDDEDESEDEVESPKATNKTVALHGGRGPRNGYIEGRSPLRTRKHVRRYPSRA